MNLKSLLLFLSATAPLAASPAATVTEAVQLVQHGSSDQAAVQNAPVGTQIQDGEYLKTGDASRAELQFINKTITRLGANTIFNYNATTNQGTLEQGSLFFSKPKNGQTLLLKTAAVTAAITGTTGFITPQLFGLIEGHTQVTFDGKTYTIGPGEVIVFSHPPQFYHFDVAKFVHNSSFLKPGTPLPTQAYIDQELADYQDLVDRGFIQPGGQFIPIPPSGLPGNPTFWPNQFIPASDNGLGSLFQAQNPPPEPPPKSLQPIINQSFPSDH